MRLNTVFAGVAALGILSAAPAFAADPVPPPEVAPVAMVEAPAPAFSWTGGYIGGHAGLGRGAIDNGLECNKYTYYDQELGEDVEVNYPIYFLVEPPGETIDFYKYDGTEEDLGRCRWTEFVGALGPAIIEGPDDYNHYWVGEPTPISGYLAGAQIGFLWQLGQGRVGFVIGAEVSHSITSLAAQLEGCWGCRQEREPEVDVANIQINDHNIGWNSEFRINSITTATLRAGVAFNRILLYGEGGLAIVNATWVNTLGFSDTVNDHGYVYGAGLEVALTDNISIFGEWNRVVIPEHRFIGQINLPIPVIGPLIGPLPTGIDVSSRTDVFKIGFNIRVGLHDHH